MKTPPAKTWVQVSKSALKGNAVALKRVIGSDAALMTVVKANAYGHGLREVVSTLKKEAEWFGVDSLAEAKAVRSAGAKQPVLILGRVRPMEIAAAVKEGFRMTVYDKDALARASKAGRKAAPALLHVKIETGTSRQGVTQEDFSGFFRLAKKVPNVRIEGLSTHFANIEDTSDPSYAADQLRRFEEARTVAEAYGIVPTMTHAAASAAALLYKNTHFSMVRAGIASYGLWPSEDARKAAGRAGHDIVPALSWKTVVAQVKRIPKGTPVSYGLTERVARDSVIAVLPVGYWDGLDRSLSSRGHVSIRGRRAKILGRVCMNMCVVDVTDIPRVEPEDVAVIIGPEEGAMTAEAFASYADTINYEAVTRINPLIPRILVP